MSQFKRAERVVGEVHAAVAAVIRDGLHDPRVTPITITSVRVSDDLAHARVNYCPLGGEGDLEAIQAGLNAAHGWIRREVARRLRLKYVPELHFHADDAVDESVRMASMLARMEAEREAGGEE